MSQRSRAALVLASAGVCAVAVASGPSASALDAKPVPKPPSASTDRHAAFDLRRGTTAADRKAMDRASGALTAKPAVQSLARSLGSQSVIDMDPVTGTPRQVARLDGTLTGPSSASAKDVALGYVSAHAAAFGLTASDIARLTLARDYVDIAGIHHLSFTQSADGIPLFGNGLKANVTKDGRLVNVTGSPAAGLTAPGRVRSLSPSAAVEAAKRGAGEKIVTQGDRDVTKNVLFKTAGSVRRAIETVTMSGTNPALSVVDAQTGRILYRSYLSSDFASGPATTATPVDPAASAKAGATALVYDVYPMAPGAGGVAKVVDLTAKGWLGANAQRLIGNNVHTYIDINDNDLAGSNEEIHPGKDSYQFALKRTNPAGEPCAAYVCTWYPNIANSWQKNAARSSAQNFYYINNWHDYLQKAPIGFTEAAGNFQKVNSSGNGLGGDPVLDQNLDGAALDNGLPDEFHIDNANFATPPDGQSPTMQMYLFHQPGLTFEEDPFIATMGSDAADVVYHEYTHGLSHRLVVDASNNPALDSAQGGSMGEAWSDWYAMDYLVNQGLVADKPAAGDVIVGDYVEAGHTIRTEGIDCPVGSTSARCPGTSVTGPGGYTYGDFAKIFAVRGDPHAAGEVWAQTLWDVRAALGAKRAESLVTRGMELSPTFPSMLDMRNSILAADTAVYGGADLKTLWKVFAKRGMGFFAASLSGDDVNPVEDFSTPPTTTQRGSLSGQVTNTQGGTPVQGVVVSFGGHASGLPGDYAAMTDADGHYTIPGIIPGTYPKVQAMGAGYNGDSTTLSIARGPNSKDWSLVRDWAAASGGATIGSFNGPDYTAFGCGPTGDIDQSLGTGWGSDAGDPKFIVIDLPAAVDISDIAVDPSNTCGDGPEAATAGYTMETSTDGTSWTTVSAGTFDASNLGRLNSLSPTTGTTGVTHLRFTMIDPQGGAGVPFLDSSEVQVYGTAS